MKEKAKKGRRVLWYFSDTKGLIAERGLRQGAYWNSFLTLLLFKETINMVEALVWKGGSTQRHRFAAKSSKCETFERLDRVDQRASFI